MFCCQQEDDVELDEDGYGLACKLADVPETGSKKVRLNGKSLAIYRYKGSKLYVIQNACSHEGVSLVGRDIEDFDGKLCITCPGHGYKFDLKTGKCLTDSHYTQRRFRVKLKDEFIYVQLKR